MDGGSEAHISWQFKVSAISQLYFSAVHRAVHFLHVPGNNICSLVLQDWKRRQGAYLTGLFLQLWELENMFTHSFNYNKMEEHLRPKSSELRSSKNSIKILAGQIL